ncbi:hypothetical protein IB238_04040 [Rhizobium sp. ARZ01]|uniref:hypothetical protein n=1 Tax=Rhizobium sp. ARZ01 TaxID=2769313 RepID=UPI0017801721|nr:hypothetical protein [Rhizobium sp. ARZ01]MBD9371811.1 hypothetical protein [Rhizobium sp. ARZ01]
MNATRPIYKQPTKLACKLVLTTMPTYMAYIGIADERWKASVARDCHSRFRPLTTDVLALDELRQ